MTATPAVIGAAIVVNNVVPRTVIEARWFVLRDAGGKSRAELVLTMIDGSSVLVLKDEEGNPGAALSVLSDGPRSVSLVAENGKTRSILTGRADGGLHEAPVALSG